MTRMEINKTWLIVGIILVVLLLLATFLVAKQMYYEKGADDQFTSMVGELVGIAMKCQPINIQLDQDRAIQLVNTACYK